MATTTVPTTFYECDDPKCTISQPGQERGDGTTAPPPGWTEVPFTHFPKGGGPAIQGAVVACRLPHVKGAIVHAIETATHDESGDRIGRDEPEPTTDEGGDDDPLFTDGYAIRTDPSAGS